MRGGVVLLLALVGCEQAIRLPPRSEGPPSTLTLPRAAPSADADFDAALDARHDPDGGQAALAAFARRWPDSPRASEAWALSGDAAFEGARGDRARLTEAREAYEQSLRTPAPANRVYAYAWYRLGWTRYELGEHAEALSALARAAREAGPRDAKVRSEALRDVVLPYAAIGQPAKAYPFLHTFATDPEAFEALAALALRYRKLGDAKAATTVYDELRRRDAARACEWEARARFTLAPDDAAEERAVRACS